MRFRSRYLVRLSVVGIVLIILLGIVSVITAQSPIPHAVMEGDDCLGCHQSGAAGAPRVSWDHLGRSNQDCRVCHQVSSAPAGEIPHPIFGRDDCLACHAEGVGSAIRLTGNHVDYANEQCLDCHALSARAAASTPIPTPSPSPTPIPGIVHQVPSAESCIACHQLIFSDTQHAAFTGQPLADAGRGKELYLQSCARCHGEDGSTPVGGENAIINSSGYLADNDDASIIRNIATGSHGEMTAFAEEYDGPLSWEEILDIAAFIRLWGPFTPGQPLAGKEPTYSNAIGPMLVETCSVCHGGTAGLDVTTYDSLMAGSDSGPVIIPGDPDNSRIVEIQRAEHYGQLDENELVLLIDWIVNGSPQD